MGLSGYPDNPNQIKKMTKLIKYILVGVLLVAGLKPFSKLTAQTDEVSMLELQRKIKENLQRAKASTVFIADYDTIAKRVIGPRFSGVVVDKSGLILTAAHASKPGQTYLVQFDTDNRQYIAVGAGRIALYDAAMIKIVSDSEFSFAEVGWSSSLNTKSPCYSFAYPGSFNPQKKTLRFGYIVELEDNRRKMLRSTCLMEPGDSGGPLFDLYGRVVGIRSNILASPEHNFDVPINTFRRYWQALQKQEDYQFLPESEPVGHDTLIATELANMKGRVDEELLKTQSSFKTYSLALTDSKDSTVAIGTLVDVNSFRLGNDVSNASYLISKSSLIPKDIFVRIEKKRIAAEVLFRDRETDLVLLRVRKKLKKGIPLNRFRLDSLSSSTVGDLLISPLPGLKSKYGILGTAEFDLPGIYNGAFLGLALAQDSSNINQNVISMVLPDSPASRSGLKMGQQLIRINDNDITSPQSLVDEIKKFGPGDLIDIDLKSGVLDTTVVVRLATRPAQRSSTFADQYPGGRSIRFDGFKDAFVHDTQIIPSLCGGPVFDLSRRLIGINIARFSRTSNIALSARVVENFIRTAEQSLGKL